MTKKKPRENNVKDNGVLMDFTRMAVRPTEVSQIDGIQNNLRYNNLTLNRLVITEMIQEHGLVRRFLAQPIADAYRGGVKIKCDELSADELAALNQMMEKEQDLEKIGVARFWSDAFGGGGLIINAGQEFDKQFSLDAISQGDKVEFYAVDRWELSMQQEGNILDQTKPHDPEIPFNYYSQRIHKTGVLKMVGDPAPSMIRGQFTGWGVSKLEGIVRSWNQYLKQQEVIYELTDEAKVDVFRLEGFKETLLSPNGAQKAAERVQLSAEMKNYRNALVLDKEDEYESKAVSFSGIAEVVNENRKGIAADFGMPMTKLFGLSAAGFNSGEDDLEVYNAKIESEYRAKDRHIVLFVIQCRCKQLFGDVPDTISFEYHPLRVMSAEQEEAIKDKKLDRIMRLKDAGLQSASKIVELINTEKIFPLDLDPDEVDDYAAQQEETEGVATGPSGGDVARPASGRSGATAGGPPVRAPDSGVQRAEK
jgi:uncharacterized protein